MGFIRNNPHRLSPETRTLNNLLRMQNLIYKLFGINRLKWTGPRSDWLFRALFNSILTISISTSAPMPSTANVKTQRIHKRDIAVLAPILNYKVMKSECDV